MTLLVGYSRKIKIPQAVHLTCDIRYTPKWHGGRLPKIWYAKVLSGLSCTTQGTYKIMRAMQSVSINILIHQDNF